MTVLRWYHEERLIDTANEPSYTASSNGDIYSLQVNSVSETELGKYTVVVSLNGLNATDSVRLRFPGKYFCCSYIYIHVVASATKTTRLFSTSLNRATISKRNTIFSHCQCGRRG